VLGTSKRFLIFSKKNDNHEVYESVPNSNILEINPVLAEMKIISTILGLSKTPQQ